MEQVEQQNQEDGQELALSEQSASEGGDSTEQTQEVGQEQVEANSEMTQAQKDLFEINGEQVDLGTLKQGYLRQSDYTRKAQELASQREQLQPYVELENYLKANPLKAQRVVQFLQGQEEALEGEIDPKEQKLMMIEQRLDQYIQNDSRREANNLINEIKKDSKYNGVFQSKAMEDMLLATHIQKGRGNNLKKTADEVYKEIVKMQAATKLQAQEELKKNLNSPTRKSVPSRDSMTPAKNLDTSKMSWAEIRRRALSN